jgi:hypothetical protein
MRIFNFFKKFSNNEEKEPEQIKLNELDIWVDSWSKNIFKNINLELEDVRKSISEEKDKTKENIQKLMKSELKNQNVQDRIKQIMEDNRRAYTQKIKKLLEKINPPKDLYEVLEFCNSFDKDLDYFSKNTVRNYHIMLELFMDKTNAITTNIKNLDKLIKKIKKILEDGEIEKVNKLKNNINEIQQKIKRKERMKEKINLIKIEQQKRNKKIKEKEENIKELEQGSRYKKFREIVDKKDILEKEIEALKMQLLYSFSVIKTTLKKYERLTLEDKLVKKYLESPINTLLEDNELKIVEIASKMKKSIIKNELKLKEKKKSKILQELNSLDKNYFEAFLRKHNELNKRLDELKSEIDKAEIIKEVELMKENLKQDKTNLDEAKYEVEEIIKEIEKININDLKRNLEKEIKENTNKEVIIS